MKFEVETSKNLKRSKWMKANRQGQAQASEKNAGLERTL